MSKLFFSLKWYIPLGDTSWSNVFVNNEGYVLYTTAYVTSHLIPMSYTKLMLMIAVKTNPFRNL